MKNQSSPESIDKRRKPKMVFGLRQYMSNRTVIITACAFMLSATSGLIIYFQFAKSEKARATEQGTTRVSPSDNLPARSGEIFDSKKEMEKSTSPVSQTGSISPENYSSERNASDSKNHKRQGNYAQDHLSTNDGGTEKLNRLPFPNNATGSGNHFSMSLENCSQVAPNVIKFDLYVVSDGASSSDLRANAFQCGINYNPDWTSSNATIEVSFVKGSTDFPDLNGFNFPMSPHSCHIRIVQAPFSKGNTGKTMQVGHPYRIGTFKLTSSENFIVGKNPDFSMQTTTVAGKTLCAAVAWIANSTTTNAVKIAGSGTAAMNRVNTNDNGNSVQLTASVSCRLGDYLTGTSPVFVYPNPAKEKVTVSFNYGKDGTDFRLTLLDLTSRQVMVKKGKTVEGANKMELDLSNLAKGVYLLDFNSLEYNSQTKITLE